MFSWLKMTLLHALDGNTAHSGADISFYPFSICCIYILIHSLLGNRWVRAHFGNCCQLASCCFLSLCMTIHTSSTVSQSGPGPTELPLDWLQGKENSKCEMNLVPMWVRDVLSLFIGDGGWREENWCREKYCHYIRIQNLDENHTSFKLGKFPKYVRKRSGTLQLSLASS